MHAYRDLVFLLSFLVNYLLLYGTNRLCGFPTGHVRTALAAALGGAYGAACTVPQLAFLGAWLWRLVFFGLMALLAFGMNASALRRGVIFFLLSMALEGLAAGIGRVNLWTVLLAAATLWLLCLVGFGSGKVGSSYVPVVITRGNRSVSLTALLDTGNTLRDPLSGWPVLVVDASVGWKLLSMTEAEMKEPLKTITSGAYQGLRLIPYHAVGQPAGLLLGIRADSVCIDGKKCDYMVAFAPHSIGQGKPFEALAGGCV